MTFQLKFSCVMCITRIFLIPINLVSDLKTTNDLVLSLYAAFDTVSDSHHIVFSGL